MRRYLIATLLFCASLPAQAVYRCEQNGTVSYDDQPCAAGRSINIAEEVRDAVSPGEVAAARKRLRQQKRTAAEIERKKAKETEKEGKARQLAARKAAAKEKKCQPLALRKKWAEEDAASADRKSFDAAQRKARRVAERYDLSCGSVQPLGMF